MKEKLFSIGLHKVCSSRKMKQLVDVFGTARAAWEAPDNLVREKVAWKPVELEEFLSSRRKVSLDQEGEKLAKAGAYVICHGEADYPANLAHIPGAPTLLYVRGDLSRLKAMAVAVVGTRKASPYGLGVARQLGRELTEAGIWVVSGMARGIDTAAHKGALAAGGTVAVLGCGVDVVYPRENKSLMEEIIATGAVVSEIPLGMGPQDWMFPARNRIISGLTLGTVVVEAEKRSGALITVDFALEQGRDVFAVPGPITSSTSQGPHNLIKQGAKLVGGIEDILEELAYDTLFPERMTRRVETAGSPVSPEEKMVLNLLHEFPLQVDELAQRLQLPTQQVLTVLMYLELKGLVQQLPGQIYQAQG
ncbi:MAG: DNA-processing protein DprA [Clostridia bacterium]|nr:DNA-processing protein DprA [Clostridia bacterium]